MSGNPPLRRRPHLPAVQLAGHGRGPASGNGPGRSGLSHERDARRHSRHLPGRGADGADRPGGDRLSPGHRRRLHLESRPRPRQDGADGAGHAFRGRAVRPFAHAGRHPHGPLVPDRGILRRGRLSVRRHGQRLRGGSAGQGIQGRRAECARRRRRSF